METPGPFIRFQTFAGGQEPDAILGFSLPFLPDMSASPWLTGSMPRERLKEALQLQLRLIHAFWKSGITALDLRFIGTETMPGVAIALLCLLRRSPHIHPAHFRDHCLSIAQYLHRLFADTGLELLPLLDEASLMRYVSPFQFQSLAEVRKKEEILVIWDAYIENEVYATYPWQWSVQNRLRLLEALLHRRSDCLVSIYLEPTQLSPQEQSHLSHATSSRVRELLWSAGSQGETISDLYAEYAQKLRQPYLIRISVASKQAQTVEQAGRMFIDELSAAQNPGTQPILVFPQNQQEWQAACQSIWHLTWYPWGTNHGMDMPGTARLRYLVDAETASMAFRIPVATQADIPGIPVRTLPSSASGTPGTHGSNSAPTPSTTLPHSSESNIATDIIEPQLTIFTISNMRRLEDLVGHMLGNYHIEALLGKGGFGAVYRARQQRLNRMVAIKIILAALTPASSAEEQHERQKMLLRFEREAQALARLDHPYILPLFEYLQNPLPSIVMPYVAGGSLADELHASGHRPMPLRGVATILSQVASALDHAHQQRLVHRDLKPQNLLRHADGRMLLSDFGIVQFEDADMPALTTHSSPYTPAYASPEQHQGLPVDYRTDIYSLGIILYELLCGKRPFKTPYEHAYAPLPALRTLGVPVPPAIETIVHKALAKRPEDRYQSASAMSTAFQAALPDE